MPTAVLHLLGTAELEGTGIARIVSAIAGKIDRRKYEVHAWFLGPSGPLVQELQSAGVATRSIPWWRGARDPVGAYRFWCCLRNQRFAVVHQHFGARSVRSLISLGSDARLVVHIHGAISDSATAARIPVEVRGADVVIAVSRAVALHIPIAKPIVVYTGVECPGKFSPISSPTRSTVVVGTACRLVPRKGLMSLLQAAAILCPEFPGLQLEIAGEGPQREALEKEVSKLKLVDRVRFLGWRRDLRSDFRKWDIFAMPSEEEGLAVTALEAMAEGLPVVSTAVGGQPELIDDDKSGFLVPPSNVAALTNRLRILIMDPNRRLAMGAAGQKRVRECFSVDRMVAEIVGIYDSLVRRK